MTEIRMAPNDGDPALLVGAIEHALTVDNIGRLEHWLRGPVAALLAFDIALCTRIGPGNRALPLACVAAGASDTTPAQRLDDISHGFGLQLAQVCRPADVRIFDAPAIHAIGAKQALAVPVFVRTAVVHRVRLLSGGDYALVLINVPEQRFEHCKRMLVLLSSHLKMTLARAIAHGSPPAPCALTPREREILALMAAGKSNREISAQLAINPITLKHHIIKIYRKLDVRNRAEAVACAEHFAPIARSATDLERAWPEVSRQA